MYKVFSTKKGVSPLIATILLIAFAVALGSVVMNWGLNLNIGKSSDRCRNIEIKTRNIDAAEVCFGGVGQNGYINFIIDNIGPVDINGLDIYIIGNKKEKFFNLDNILIGRGALYEKKDREITYDFSSYGDIKQVKFIPKIKLEKIEVCLNRAVDANDIKPCSQ